MKNQIYLNYLVKSFICALIITYTGCNSSTKTKPGEENIQTEESNNTENEKGTFTIKNKKDEKKETLLIEGTDIWIRETPSTGEVVMKLNTGDECEILHKGKSETIRGNFDYWYKIRFNRNVGWVFGSQTSIKQNVNRSKKNKNDFQTFFSDFIQKYSDNKADLSSFVHSEIGVYEGTNPGVMCYGNKVNNNFSRHEFDFPLKNIFNTIPEGSFCEGYKTKDGFYYSINNTNKLPAFGTYDKDGGYIAVNINIPDKYIDASVLKVLVINDEWLNFTFYFINIDNSWYFICQNFCDCSA